LKRLFDILVSLLQIIFILSWVYVIVFVISKCTMRGPIMFRQKRSGKDGKVFNIYKFRTMRENDEADTLPASDDDPRCTRFGTFLRRTCVDELPQLLNILKGDMSLVGPRPHMIADTEHYSALIPNYMDRLKMTPGLTGWAQVNGYRGATPELWMMEKRVEYDLWYIEHHSIWLDIKIINKEFALFFKKVFSF